MVREKIETYKHALDKSGVVQLMMDLELYDNKKAAGKAYDAVSAVINAWIMTGVKDLPKGNHYTLCLRDAFTLHICWRKGHNNFPDYQAIWIRVAAPARSIVRRVNKKIYGEWFGKSKKSRPESEADNTGASQDTGSVGSDPVKSG